MAAMRACQCNARDCTSCSSRRVSAAVGDAASRRPPTRGSRPGDPRHTPDARSGRSTGQARAAEIDRDDVGSLARRERADARVRPSARAPLRVAISSTACAGRAVGSPLVPLASSAACRISANMSSRLLLAAPSVPMPTLTPRRPAAATGAMPLASLRFDDGQCATWQPWLASSSISPRSGAPRARR